MFWLKYFFKNVLLAFNLLRRGNVRRVFQALHARVYRKLYGIAFNFRAPFIRGKFPTGSEGQIQLVTEHPVAFTSPDHVAPLGTKYDNSTNRKFVLHMNALVRRQFDTVQPGFMDLGCSGGQLVADFRTLGWLAVGLEGSDYSLKTRRANWKHLAKTNLFTCDITKPFQVKCDGNNAQFHLITAWEVLEHIHTKDLDVLFGNIQKHLVNGGYFIASTASGPSIVNGIELHQTRWTNDEWKQFLRDRFPNLIPTDVHLKTHQYVRYDFGEPSFLVYQKTADIRAPAAAAVRS